MWPSVVVHEHWPVSQRMIVEMGQRNPKCQNIDELRTAILREWQQFPQERLRRLVRSMTRRVTEPATKVKHHPIFLSINNKIDITIFLTLLKRLHQGLYKITNLRSFYHPERHDYDVAKMGFKTGAGKT
jgi:hypothetical protein